VTVLLQADHAGKMYGKLAALRDVSLSIDQDRPSITAVVGESGSGKTTLARVLLGLVAPTTGRVLYHGQDLRRLGTPERRAFRRDVQAIFQDPYEVYNPFYRVDHVLTTPVRKFRLAKTASEARGLVEAALRAVGLRPDEILGRFPHQLSGGQRQRIMVARAVLLQPKLIVADEPVSMVDASLRATILGTIVTQPHHPYTKLLIASIPRVSTDRTWMGDTAPNRSDVAGSGGCSFSDRCPVAMTKCVEAVPPLYRTGADRAVACYQYEASPELSAENLGDILVKSPVPSGHV
jgi:oligopeptide/dipeptide ABC transporter ATP-binding protein